jgi:hypothetical protein
VKIPCLVAGMIAGQTSPTAYGRMTREPLIEIDQRITAGQQGSGCIVGMWGGWGSNPRPADYEKYDVMHHSR